MAILDELLLKREAFDVYGAKIGGIMWRQRTRTLWLHVGENNTKFFQLVANAQNRSYINHSIDHEEHTYLS